MTSKSWWPSVKAMPHAVQDQPDAKPVNAQLCLIRAGTARVPPCSGFADRPQAFAAWVRLPRRLDSSISVSERAS